MTTSLPELTARFEASRAAGEFVAFAKYLALGGDAYSAHEIAERKGASQRVLSVLKAAIAAGTTSDATFAASIVGHAELSGAFLDSLAGRSVFDSLVGSMVPAPLRERIAVVSSAIYGDELSEDAATPVSDFSVDGAGMQPKKVQALVVLTRELLKGSAQAQRLLEHELKKAVAKATDRVFIEVATDGLSPLSATGSDALAARADLSTLLLSIAGSDSATYAFVMNPALAKRVAGISTTIGSAAFPEMTPNGGRLVGVSAYTSDAIAADEVLALDASQFCADPGLIAVESASHASISMSDSPSGSAAPLVSLWQTGAVGLRATRWLGIERLRDGATAIMDGVTWGEPES